MRVIAFDPGASCGYAVADIDGSSANIFEYGVFNISQDLPQGEQIHLIRDICVIKVQTLGVNLVGMENYFANSKFSSGTDLNYFLRAGILLGCYESKTRCEVINPSNWKVLVAGRSTPTKEQKLQYGKAVAKKAMIVEALRDRYGIRVPNHSLSEKTGKPIQFRYDTTDAIGQVMYACNLVTQILKFTCSVAVPADVDLTAPKKRKKDPV